MKSTRLIEAIRAWRAVPEDRRLLTWLMLGEMHSEPGDDAAIDLLKAALADDALTHETANT